MRIVPSTRKPKVGVSSCRVPRPAGLSFFAPRKAAMAIGAIIGRKRLNMMTRPVAISQGMASGEGLVLLAKPKATPRPSNAEPLLAEAEENW